MPAMSTAVSSDREAPQFITKLRGLLDELGSESLQWTDNGLTITIDEARLFDDVLRGHFTTTKPCSFIRQLHMHGFRQDRQVGTTRTYRNSLFTRNNPALQTQIRRKTIGRNRSRAATASQSATTSRRRRRRSGGAPGARQADAEDDAAAEAAAEAATYEAVVAAAAANHDVQGLRRSPRRPPPTQAAEYALRFTHALANAVRQQARDALLQHRPHPYRTRHQERLPGTSTTQRTLFPAPALVPPSPLRAPAAMMEQPAAASGAALSRIPSLSIVSPMTSMQFQPQPQPGPMNISTGDHGFACQFLGPYGASSAAAMDALSLQLLPADLVGELDSAAAAGYPPMADTEAGPAGMHAAMLSPLHLGRGVPGHFYSGDAMPFQPSPGQHFNRGAVLPSYQQHQEQRAQAREPFGAPADLGLGARAAGGEHMFMPGPIPSPVQQSTTSAMGPARAGEQNLSAVPASPESPISRSIRSAGGMAAILATTATPPPTSSYFNMVNHMPRQQ